MTPAPLEPDMGEPELHWTADGAPRSSRFDDVYFSTADGLAESRAVFLQGCDLPQAWADRRHFTVAELGFGTGLNILGLLDLWRRTRTPDQRLSIFSIEGFPLEAQEAARALAAWPELSDLAQRLVAAWPRRAPGFHRIDFPDLGATLDLALGDVDWALAQWTGQADAWFLDGFSPAKNPQMWRDEVLAAVARRSAPGARVGTFTVAGAVRRGLQAAGFEVAKAPGHGKKRERLEARLPGAAPSPSTPAVAVIGAGIAGAALVRALQVFGAEAMLLDTEGPGAGASGNPAAMVSAAFDAGGGARAGFYAQALARAHDLYAATPGAVLGQGVLQMERVERDAARFDAVVASGVFDPGRMERPPGGLFLHDGQVIDPKVAIAAWIGPVSVIRGAAASLVRTGNRWRVLDAQGAILAEADVLCLAVGHRFADLWPSLPSQPVRGQASWARAQGPDTALAWGGYAVSFGENLLFGATHDRDRDDVDVLAADHARNLKTLAEVLPQTAAGLNLDSLEGRAGVRAATPDRMPLAGTLGREGLYGLGGLGSRGFATAPLLAEHVAALICAAPSPLPAEAQRIVDPARFSDAKSP